ncbi:MAG: cytochrome d ubiquinol oxidase subunit II [Desulfovibrionaceae bacterium]|nr:cytochrome d ubiquinol oxidase subunit II [Desulfovibrionaceae bacterium]
MLETVWFVLWGLLWAVYFVLDGFDFGLGIMLPRVARTEDEKRIVYNAAGPYWDGNEVWLITAGGATFAAFPGAYAALFSALYAPLFIILIALIFRAVSYEFRSHHPSARWRARWDRWQFIGNAVPAFLFGVAFANLFRGIPLDAQGVYHGNILFLLNPYGFFGGVLFLLMFSLHGALWLALKSTDDIHERALQKAEAIWGWLAAVTVIFLLLTAVSTNLYDNSLEHPVLFVFPILAALSLIAEKILIRRCIPGSWICSSLFIICVVFFGVCGMYPSLIISSMDPTATLTIFNSASSELTLKIMLGVVAIFVPLVIGYQAWAYSIFAQKITPESLKAEDHAY